MKCKVLSVFQSVLLLCGIQAYAEQNQTIRLSIDDCVDMALHENREIKSAKSVSEQTLHSSRAVKANFFPRVSLNAADVWGSLAGSTTIDMAGPVSQYIVNRVSQLAPGIAASETGSWYLSTVESRLRFMNPDIDYRMGNIFSANLTVEQPLYTGGKIQTAYRMSRLGETMSQLGIEISEDDIIFRTYEAYALAIKAREMIVVADKYDSLLVSVRGSVESALAHGMASQADLMKINSELGKSELQKNKARNGYRLACMGLCQIIGLPLTSELDLDTLAMVDVSDAACAPAHISSRSEYDLLQAKTRLAGLNVKLEKAAFLPQVGVSVGGGYLNGLRMMGGNVFDNEWHVMALVNVKVPIFHGMEGHHKVAAAQAAYRQSEYERDNLYEMMELEIQNAYNELSEASIEADVYERVFVSAGESYRVARVRYEKGMETLTDLLTAQVEWQNAYASMIDARHSLVVKEIAWLKANGQLKK